MIEIHPVRLVFFWLLVAAFTFGNSERFIAVVSQPTADRLGLLCVSALAFVMLCFLKPGEVQ